MHYLERSVMAFPGVTYAAVFRSVAISARCVGLFAMAVLACSNVHAQPAAAALYQQHCARCHNEASAANRAPNRDALGKLSRSVILSALTTGVMKEQGSSLSAEQLAQVADWLGSAPATAAGSRNNSCAADFSAPRNGGDWTGWGNNLSNWRYQPDPGLTAQDVPHLKLKWAYAVPGVNMMRSQPVVYHGRLYLGGQDGTISSLDALSGCVHWTAQSGRARSGLVIGRAGTQDALFFGDATGFLYALSLQDGTELWKLQVSDHKGGLITGTPAYANGRLYVPLASAEEVLAITPGFECCTFRGSVSAVDATTGKLLWRSHTITEPSTERGDTRDGRPMFGPSGAAVWSSPTIDLEKNALYVTTGDNYGDPATATSDAVLAFGLELGDLLWSKQFTTGDVFNLACDNLHDGTCKNGSGPDFDFGASPILVKLPSDKRCLLLGQKSGMVYAIDPDRRGELLWQKRAGRGGSLGGIQWGPATDGHLLYVALSDLAFAKSAGPKKIALDPGVGGGMVSYTIDSGEEKWRVQGVKCGDRRPCSPAQSAAVTSIPGVVFSGSLDGHIRAYSASGGEIVWDFDTERSYDTVNGVPGAGGSIDAAGPVVADGMVFVLSGYPVYGGKSGNVLLAFGRN